MKKIIAIATGFFLIIFLFIPTITLSEEKTTLSAQQGIYLLQEMELQDKKFYLRGQWEFYWQELLQPEDFQHSKLKVKPQYIEVPGTWAKTAYTGIALSNHGYGTYRLHIQLDEKEKDHLFSLYLPSVASAFQLWVNGKPIARNGKVGIDRQSMKPRSFSQVVTFQPESKDIELVMQVSNFSQRKGGMWSPIIFGYEHVIKEHREFTIIRDIIIASSVLALSFYYISLYLFRVTSQLPIFLGIFCLLVSLRVLLVGNILLMQLFPLFPWELSVKIEYLTFYIGFMVVFLFLAHTFPQEINKKIVKMTLSVCIIFSLTTLFPAIIFTQFLSTFQIWIGFMLLYLLYIVSLAALRKREGSYLNFFTIVVLMIAIINDLFLHNSWLETIDLTPIAAALFLFIQTLVVAQKSSEAFKRAESLSVELLKINASLEQKVAERTKDLQEINSQLLHIETSRKSFYSSVAHEIGTPMQIMQGYIQIMQSKVESEELQEYLTIIYEKSKFFHHLTKDLQDLAKMDEGQFEYTFEHINVHFFLEYIVKQLKHYIENEGLHFQHSALHTIEGVSIYAWLDVTRMEQVFLNLIQNSIKFTPTDGTIEIDVDCTPIVRDTLQGSLSIRVTDNGQGIDAELLPHVFKRFMKGNAPNKAQKGSGLGLAISKEIIHKHQGNIYVESELGKGSTFTIVIPVNFVKEDIHG